METVNGSVVFKATGTQSFDTGGRLFTGFRFYITPRDALEVNYSYSPTEFADTLVETRFMGSQQEITTSSARVPLAAHFYSFNYVRRWSNRTRWAPFLTAGIGGVYWSGGFAGNQSFVVNLGGGVDYRLSERWGVRAEYRGFVLKQPVFKLHEYNHALTAGVVFRF